MGVIEIGLRVYRVSIKVCVGMGCTEQTHATQYSAH